MFDFVALDGLAGKVAAFIGEARQQIAAIRAMQEESIARQKEMNAEISRLARIIEDQKHGP